MFPNLNFNCALIIIVFGWPVAVDDDDDDDVEEEDADDDEVEAEVGGGGGGGALLVATIGLSGALFRDGTWIEKFEVVML